MLPFALFALLTVSQAKVSCDGTHQVVPKQVQRAAQGLRQELAKNKLKVTDLSDEAQASYRLLEAQVRTHAWCGADQQIQAVKAAIREAAGGKRVASAKASANANPIANAKPAHRPVSTPDPAPTAFAPSEELPDKEISAGCPGFAKGRPYSVAQVLDQLATTLERSQVRTVEIRRGPPLADQLEQAVRLHDNPRAMKTACVLTYRASLVTDNLDRAMARFQRINVLRDKRGLSEAEKPKFDALVNDASAQIAARDYPGARGTLETLLVFMGDPARPSESLPHL